MTKRKPKRRKTLLAKLQAKADAIRKEQAINAAAQRAISEAILWSAQDRGN